MPVLSQDRLAGLYGRTGRWLGILEEHSRGFFDGVWLSLLSAETLARIDERFSMVAEYTEESYNRSGLSAWERRALEAHFSQAHRIIVTSAGGGREVLALRRDGREALGYEPHPELARIGSRLTEAEGFGACVLPSPRDVWPATGRTADGVIVGWGAYMLIAGRNRRIEYLRAAAKALPVGAPVLLSFFVRPPEGRRWRSTARVASFLQALFGGSVELGDSLAPNCVHFFTRDEVAAEMKAGGFDMVDYGDHEYGWAVGRRLDDSMGNGRGHVEG